MRPLAHDEYEALMRMFREPTPETVASIPEEVIVRLMARGLLTADHEHQLYVWNHAALDAVQCTYLASRAVDLTGW